MTTTRGSFGGIVRALAGVGACVAALALSTLALSTQAFACTAAGVIIRIEGDPAAISIRHADGGQVTRPRILEVVCGGDNVHAQKGASVTLSLDGVGPVLVTNAYTVGVRRGAPSLAGNAYRAIGDQVMPDMKRLPWTVRLKGGDDPLSFALPDMALGTQVIPAGSRALLIRVAGGEAPYKATLAGETAPLAVTSLGADILFLPASLQPGRYSVKVQDASGDTVEAQFTVTATPEPLPDTYAQISDAEVRAAATAVDLARRLPAARALEAEQLLANAPRFGLDRDRVFALTESYGLSPAAN
jgi:hypothetical protein